MTQPPQASSPPFTTYQTLTVQTHPQSPTTLHVTLQRPKKRNAMNSQMFRDISHLFSHLDQSPTHRCVLLTGAGPSFCGGIDTSDPTLINYVTRDDADVARRILSFRPQITDMQRAISSLEKCPLPVVVAIRGWCIGAGVDLVCAADVRLCDDTAVFSIREVRVGLAADVGTLQRFPKIVGGGSRVRELCLTGEDFDASEAERIGFVSRVCRMGSLEEEAVKICERVGTCSPVAVAVTKESLVFSRDCSVEEGLEHVKNINAGVLLTNDLMVGKGANFEPLLPHSRL